MNPTSTPRKRSLWPFFIVLLLGGHASAMLLAVHVAGGSSGHTLVPEYYDRGSTWDEARAAAARSDALGWTLAVTPAVLGDGDGQRSVSLVLRDPAGDPVSGAAVTVRVYHHSIGQRSEATARAAEGGNYFALLPMDRAGAYQVETVATQGGLEFRDTRRVDVASTVQFSATETRPARGGEADTAR